MIIAIDGPAGAGKGAASKLLAERLGYIYIDTGAMYRCITLKMIRNQIPLEDEAKIQDILKHTKIQLQKRGNKQSVILDGEDVTQRIRESDVTGLVSPVSSIKIIRENLVEKQRELAKDGNVVMEGRDITTVVFPYADVKIYLTATEEERAKRRYKENRQKGIMTTYEEVLANVKDRDQRDQTKEMGALKIAEDAVVIDSTNLSVEEVYQEMNKLVLEKLKR